VHWLRQRLGLPETEVDEPRRFARPVQADVA